jgi:DNA-binding CsgD family transcriptional regulator
MLISRFWDISRSTDAAALQRNLVAVSEEMGFPLVNAVMVCEDKPGALPTFTSVGNTPRAFAELSHDPADSQRDPVNAVLKSTSVPFLYDQNLYVAHRAGDLWETQAAHGYRTGICVALHLPERRHFLLGLDREERLPDDESDLTRMLANLQLLAVHAQAAAQTVLVPETAAHPVPRLTPRELEILRWTMDGKTAWEIGRVICVSEHTVNYHLRNVFAKLDCSSKHQAVLTAQRYGLL